MSLPIPENELGLVFLSTLIFSLTASLALMLDGQKITNRIQNLSLQSLGLFAALSYVAALGRSDEPHLWYGLVWLSLLIIYVVMRIFTAIFNKEPFSIRTSIALVLLLFGYSWLMLELKSPVIFLLSLPVLFMIMTKFKPSVFSLIMGGSIATILVFHSVSYLQLRYQPFSLPSLTGWQSSSVRSDPPEIGGMLMDEPSRTVLDQIRADIPQTEQYLFIFPKNMMLHEYFHLTNPTRYIILANERSHWTEQEIIDDLTQTQTKYFLIFPDSAKLRHGEVWDWILANTQIVKTYNFAQETTELRTRSI